MFFLPYYVLLSRGPVDGPDGTDGVGVGVGVAAAAVALGWLLSVLPRAWIEQVSRVLARAA